MFGDDMIFCERQQVNKPTRPQDYKFWLGVEELRI